MEINEESVRKALSYVDDPDLNQDIVTLGMVRQLRIEGRKISFTVMLTTPACPMKEAIQSACVNAIRHFLGKDLEVEVHMDAAVTSKREDHAVLPGVKNIIAVASGKGGVGKSTVAVNLALALSQLGARVGIMDADIYGPSVPLMLNLKNQRPSIKVVQEKQLMEPLEAYGIKALSIGMLIDEKQAVVWRGPMVSSALRQFVTDCDWGELDYLVIDLPPGTGDIHLTLVQTVPVTGAVIVTTPQEVALADARKAMGMFHIHPIDVPILGIVENMSYFTPEELPENKYYLFGKGGGEKLSSEYQVPLLAQIPLVQSIREGGDEGEPVVTRKNHPAAQAFMDLAYNVARSVSIRNAGKKKTEVVEIHS